MQIRAAQAWRYSLVNHNQSAAPAVTQGFAKRMFLRTYGHLPESCNTGMLKWRNEEGRNAR
jgi:hypothetical protein